MKKIFLFLLLPFFSFAQLQKSISPSEINYAQLQLEGSKQKLLNEVKGLSKSQLSFKPAPDKWSIEEVLEHISLAETGLFAKIEEGLKAAPDSSQRKDIQVTDDQIRGLLTDRTGKRQAPEVLKPTGKFADLNEALKYFETARNKNINFIKTTKEDLRNRTWKHPAMGSIDFYQTLLFISAHSERHIAQIVEVKQHPKFPKI